MDILHNFRSKLNRRVLNLVHKAIVTATDAIDLASDAIKMDESVRDFSNHIVEAWAETTWRGRDEEGELCTGSG